MMSDGVEHLADNLIESSNSEEASKAEALHGSIPGCCVSTISMHVRFNPMMVCADCKNIIKCFDDERAYQNYLKFCQSRRRPILMGRVENYWTIAFRSYDSFGR